MTFDEQEFADYLDEIYGDVEIAGLEYGTGRALYYVDPIAFRVAMSEMEDDEDDD